MLLYEIIQFKNDILYKEAKDYIVQFGIFKSRNSLQHPTAIPTT